MRYWIGALLLWLSGYSQATELVIYTWEYYLAPEVKTRFEQETGIHIKEVNYDSDEARNRLLSGGYPPEFDMVSIDSLSLKDPMWKDLFIVMPQWISQQNQAQEWAFTENCGELSVPYMWGSIGIAYRRSRRCSIYVLVNIFTPPNNHDFASLCFCSHTRNHAK